MKNNAQKYAVKVGLTRDPTRLDPCPSLFVQVQVAYREVVQA